mmetsp:Transcript_43233/g.129716  ORF Transcript_43233/g.129716 Transcript_43233/m.129716 type:complete len:138 (+) Transcript_43233:91-504(+)
MSSKLMKAIANPAVATSSIFEGKASAFFHEVCRCLPFIHRLHRGEEVISLPTLRRIVKAKILENKDVTDPRVVDMLIFKGREELETYLMLHKNRHHLITEYAEPYEQSLTESKKPTGNSGFLDSFYTTGYPQITRKD